MTHGQNRDIDKLLGQLLTRMIQLLFIETMSHAMKLQSQILPPQLNQLSNRYEIIAEAF